MANPRWDTHLASARTRSDDDDQALRDIPVQYSYYVDSGNIDDLEEMLTDDCESEHVQWHTTGHGKKEAADHYRRVDAKEGYDFAKTHGWMRHCVSNVLTRKSPDRKEGVCTSYFTTTQLRDEGGHKFLQFLGGFYTFKVRKVGEQWKIYYLKVDRTFDVNIPGANERGLEFPTEWEEGTHAPR